MCLIVPRRLMSMTEERYERGFPCSKLASKRTVSTSAGYTCTEG